MIGHVRFWKIIENGLENIKYVTVKSCGVINFKAGLVYLTDLLSEDKEQKLKAKKLSVQYGRLLSALSSLLST